MSSETLAFARFGGIERSEVDLLNSRSYLISLSQQLRHPANQNRVVRHSAVNQIRVLRHASLQPIRIEFYVTQELSARVEDPSRLAIAHLNTYPPPSRQLYSLFYYWLALLLLMKCVNAYASFYPFPSR